MGACPTNCGSTVNPTGKNCCRSLKTRKAGIKAVILLSCEVDLDSFDIRNLDQVRALVAEGKIGMVQDILAQKPDTNFTEAQIYSCAPQVVTGAVKSITWEDREFDDADVIFHFYNKLQREKLKYRAAYYTCDGRFFGWIEDFSAKTQHVIPQTSADLQMWKAELAWNSEEEIVPIMVPDLLEALCGTATSEGTFTAEVINDSVDAVQGGTGYAVNLAFARTINCTGTITSVSIVASHAGITVAPISPVIGLTGSTTFDVDPSVPPGKYTITYTFSGCATASEVVVQEVNVNSSTPGFKFLINDDFADLSTGGGASQAVDLEIDNEGMTGDFTVDLDNVSPATPEITLNASPVTVAVGATPYTPITETVTLNFGSLTPNDTYSIRFKCTNGLITKYQTITITTIP